MPDRPVSDAPRGEAPPPDRGLARRDFRRLAGLTGAALAAAPLLRQTGAAAETPRSGPTLLREPTIAGAPPAEQLHLQFTADASRGAVASWVTPVRVARPQLR